MLMGVFPRHAGWHRRTHGGVERTWLLKAAIAGRAKAGVDDSISYVLGWMGLNGQEP